MAYTTRFGKLVRVHSTYRADGKRIRKADVPPMLSIDGKPVGIITSAKFRERSMHMPADTAKRLQLLTSGIIESKRKDAGTRHDEMYRHAEEADAMGLKGVLNGMCNRTQCLETPATWYNHSTRKHYCEACAHLLNTDTFNQRDAMKMYGHTLCTLVEDAA